MYFAKEKDVIGLLEDKASRYYQYLERSGILELWRRSYEYYYQAKFTRGNLYRQGLQGEYLRMDIAEYRNILSHIKNLTTEVKPAFNAVATSTDDEAQTQAVLGKSILEAVMKQHNMDEKFTKCLEYALVYGDGYMVIDWDSKMGKPFSPDGKVIDFEGDLDIRVHNPYDVIKDTRADSGWYLVRDYRNKYNMAAKFPEVEEEIEDMAYYQDDEAKIHRLFFDDEYMLDATDIIPVYTFYHARTPAMPNGRMVQFSHGVKFFDIPLPYQELPVYRMMPGTLEGTSFGYTIAYDLLPIAEGINNLVSTMITNEAVGGVQMILDPIGSGIDVQDIDGGLKVIKYNPINGMKPEALNLLNTSPHTYKLFDLLKGYMQTISGIPSITRGDVPTSLRSGSALAMVQSMAIQFNSGLQQSYIHLLEKAATGILDQLKSFAGAARFTELINPERRSYLKEWNKETLTGIRKVTPEVVNPLQQTSGGKMQIAEQLAQTGLLKDPNDYIQTLTTGNLDHITKGPVDEQINIDRENEELLEGNLVPVLDTDDHAAHAIGHMAMLSTPEARFDPQRTQAILQHALAHIDAIKNTDPVILALTSPKSLEALQMAMQFAPAPPVGADNTQGTPSEVVGTEESGTSLPNLPQTPADPLTGEQAGPDVN